MTDSFVISVSSTGTAIDKRIMPANRDWSASTITLDDEYNTTITGIDEGYKIRKKIKTIPIDILYEWYPSIMKANPDD